jgi:succinate-semialdehyde dehydrogenase / glutarate-semialdehyde dehydrogenase
MTGLGACENALDDAERSDMAVAIRQDALIGGEWVPGDGEEIEVRNPATDELLGTVNASSATQVEAAVRTAAEAFPTWRKVSLLERVELCRAAFAICMERADEIAEQITKEVGKTIRESREEMVEYTADHFRRASEDVLRHAGKVLPSTQERSNAKRIIVVQEPVGVIAAVTPWNFPVDIAGIPIVYGLAVGCTVVWKPSEQAPLCANMFAEVIHDAGFPPGTLNVVHGRGDVGSALVNHPDVASVVFTGSSKTGEQVARDAALKNRVLELGGNGPQIVLADANVAKAADAAIVGCFYLAGQCCTAAERILVHESVKDEFIAALVERTKVLRVGDPLDDETDMGPLCTDEVLARTVEHVEDAVAKGARIVYGGGHEGRFHEPTILDGVTSDMTIAKEETFGPVAPIMTFGDLEEALAVANETDYGLTAAVFTRSLHDAWHAAEELRHGTVHINETTNYWDQLAPFGGAKKSGAGRELAGWIIDALTETKQITFDLAD